MKKLTIAALLAAQLLGAMQPLAAAPLDNDRIGTGEQYRGTFIGARFRVPFGGENAGRPRAALSLTSVEHGRQADGRVRTRFAEGIELGMSANRPLALSIGGVSFARRLAAAQGDEPQPTDNRRRQERTGRTILKGIAVVAIVGVAVVGGLYLALTVACDGNRCDE
ncbi:MAG TPA: hypothetical protein VGO55_06965 [Allosphingosinicella sp.]|jgi:hypothetical protein|nr:hypothetical protein [Allosphingosinicella sp.]